MNPAHLTTARKAQIMKSLELVEGSYGKGQITKATYIQRKDDLQRLLNQSRTLPNSNLSKNPGSFFSRDVLNLSPAPVGFLNRFGLKQGQRALNNEVAPSPTLSTNIANQMVNQGWNRANNTDIRKALLETSNRESWNDFDIQSALNNQESTYLNAVDNLSGALGLSVTNLPSYDRISKEQTGTYQAEGIVHNFISRIHNLDFSDMNIKDQIETEARAAAISLYYAQIPPEDIQSVLVNAIVGTSSELLNSYDALEAVNNGANVMNTVKNSPSGSLFNSVYDAYNDSMNPSMTDPLKAVDLPTLYAMSQEADGNYANQIEAEILSRKDAMAAHQRSSKSNKIQNNATGRGYNTEQAVKNRWATNEAFETSMEALKTKKADLNIVMSDILTIDGKTIYDESTGQIGAFTTEQEITLAIQGINYSLRADYWDSADIQRMTNAYNALTAQLSAMNPNLVLPSAASLSMQSPSGNFIQNNNNNSNAGNNGYNTNPPSQQSNNNNNSNNGSNGYTKNLNQNMNQNLNQNMNQNLNQNMNQNSNGAFNYFGMMANSELKEVYGYMTQDLATDPSLENDNMFMGDLKLAHTEMVSRGLLNNGMQGAPRTLGLLSGALSALDGVTTSTSTSSAHGAMRTHVANTNNDPREGLYEY